MRVTVHKEIPEDPALRRDWNQLVERMEHPEVFFTYEWALAVSRAFHATVTPLLLLIYDNDELRGVAALATSKDTGATVSFLSKHTADYCDVVSAPETRAYVLTCFLQELKKLGLHRFSLTHLPIDSLTWKELPAVSCAQRLHLTWQPAHEIALVQFGSDEERSAMISAVGRKKAIKNSLKRLSQRGSVRIRHVVEPDQSSRCVSEIISAQISRFLATGRISPLLRAERRMFLRELANLLSAQGWLRISQLELNGEPVAWNYGFRFRDSWFWYLPSFKLDYEDCSPGSCLLRLAVEEGCSDSSLRELDLGLGDEAYKSRFATTSRITCDAQLSRRLWQHALNTAWSLAKVQSTRFPKVAARLRPARDFARSLQQRVRTEGTVPTIARPVRRLLHLIASQEEALFFDAPAADRFETANLRLEPATWENLAAAAMAYADDPDTLQSLMRLAACLNEGRTGFVLYDPQKLPVHFLAVAQVNGLHIHNLDHTIGPEDSEGVLIFDWRTPARHRGLGYCALAIRWAATELQNTGQRVRIVCTASDTVSIKEILRAGFTYRYSLVRQQRLGQSGIVRRDRTYALPRNHPVMSKQPDLAVGTEVGG